MKCIKFTETRNSFTTSQIFALGPPMRIYTEYKLIRDEYKPFITFVIPGRPSIELKLKTPERPIMNIIAEFLENDSTVLDVTEYCATNEEE